MSDEVVAFVASNDTTHLVPLSGTHIVVAAPMVQGTVKAAASSLVRPLRVQLDASRPLTAWRFIVLDAHGQIVYSSRGAAPDGGARSVWSGLTTGSSRARRCASQSRHSTLPETSPRSREPPRSCTERTSSNYVAVAIAPVLI